MRIALIYAAYFATISMLTLGDLSAQVLTQTNKDLGNGYRFQESKQINVSGRWHSDRSFKFLYFEKRHLCQCTEFSISPSGQYAVYQMTGSKEIASFRRDKNTVTVHSKLPLGKLKQVTWGKIEKNVELEIQTNSAGDETTLVKRRLKLP
ncbi:hypothetical protein [Undibacterium fentianense]|uniref:Lipocalin-like domain-containing protein n=1 Tax=Undibacterium fentianense TaxID=2828728 RepID=A0A941E102_9BURK|nr:hypothetical protein [Undibacterium fentianense]MBR7800375.1 hypothetical protein [Undibacterium fentianense]